MYPDWVVPAVAGLLALWLGILSFLIWKEFIFLRSLFPTSGERDIRRKFEDVFRLVYQFKGDLSKLEDKLARVEHKGLGHIQKVELLRYNPYEDTGGNVSFSLAALDEKGNGFVLTSLHARSGTRMFAKVVEGGKAKNIKLSKEEEDVVAKAMKKNLLV